MTSQSPVLRSLRRRLGDVRRRFRSRPSKTAREKESLLNRRTLDSKDCELLRVAESKISRFDGMYIGNGAHYFSVGLSAIRCIDKALVAARIETPRSVLDFPCGYGRVLRFLVQRFPAARFTAGDLDGAGADFCAEVFGAEAVYSTKDLNNVSLGKQFDLIWCGSLITHVNEPEIVALLNFFSHHTVKGGLLVFTTAGDRVVQRMIDRDDRYGLLEFQLESVVRSYQQQGFGYSDYPYLKGYGISVTSAEWIRQHINQATWKKVYFEPHGWDDHQDVFGFVRQ